MSVLCCSNLANSPRALFCAGLVVLIKSELFPDVSKPAAFQLNGGTVNENAVTGAGQAEGNYAAVSCALPFSSG